MYRGPNEWANGSGSAVSPGANEPALRARVEAGGGGGVPSCDLASARSHASWPLEPGRRQSGGPGVGEVQLRIVVTAVGTCSLTCADRRTAHTWPRSWCPAVNTWPPVTTRSGALNPAETQRNRPVPTASDVRPETAPDLHVQHQPGTTRTKIRPLNPDQRVRGSSP